MEIKIEKCQTIFFDIRGYFEISRVSCSQMGLYQFMNAIHHSFKMDQDCYRMVKACPIDVVILFYKSLNFQRAD